LPGLGAIQREGAKFQIWTLQIVQGVSKNFEKKKVKSDFRWAESARGFRTFLFFLLFTRLRFFEEKNSKMK
jgi:hypothetical protein